MSVADEVSAAAAERIAREHYGIEARATALPGELDLNFALDDRYVLKLCSPDAALDLQDAALEHLAELNEVPRLVRTLDGSARVSSKRSHGTVSRHSSRPAVARVLTWLPGTPWAARGDHGPEALASLGRAVARVDGALATFEHPALDRPLRWNMPRAGDLRPGAPELAAPVLERFGAEILPRLQALPAQAIHNDANEHNVLVDERGEVTGLIDFGDVCRAPRACGLAVACAYAMTALPAPERQIAPLVAGYHEVAPLAPDELALLPT